jgi:hypothetical protein
VAWVIPADCVAGRFDGPAEAVQGRIFDVLSIVKLGWSAGVSWV